MIAVWTHENLGGVPARPRRYSTARSLRPARAVRRTPQLQVRTRGAFLWWNSFDRILHVLAKDWGSSPRAFGLVNEEVLLSSTPRHLDKMVECARVRLPLTVLARRFSIRYLRQVAEQMALPLVLAFMSVGLVQGKRSSAARKVAVPTFLCRSCAFSLH